MRLATLRQSFFAVIAATLTISTPLNAQQDANLDAEELAAAANLVKSSGAAAQMDAILPLVINQMKTVFLQQKPALRDPLEKVFSKLESRFKERQGELLAKIAIIYAQAFTTKEMQDVTAFFKSDAGKRFVEEAPGIQQKSFQAGSEWGRKVGEEIGREVEREMRQKGHKL